MPSLALAFLTLCMTASARVDTVRLDDGEMRSVSSIRFDGRRAVMQDPVGGEEVIDVSRLVRWERDLPASAAISDDPASMVVVHLHDGSRLQGRILSGGEATLELELRPGSAISLSVDAVHAVMFGPGAASQDPAKFRIVEDGDAIFRRLEAGGDFTTGQFLSFGKDRFRFKYSLGEADFPLDELVAVVLSPLLEIPEPDPQGVEVDLVPDGRLAGAWIGSNGNSVRIVPLFAEAPIDLPLTGVRGLRFRGPSHRWLSDTPIAQVQQTSFLGAPELFLYPYRLDRSVSGAPLQVQGRRFPKGIGCHSQCSLEWDLEQISGGPWSRFVASAGIADEVLSLADRGAVEFVVSVDGEERFRSGVVRGGEAPRSIPAVDLRGARRLQLLVEFSEGQDVADRAVWGDALLLSR